VENGESASGEREDRAEEDEVKDVGPTDMWVPLFFVLLLD
jgi:hypothetical protein